MKDSFDFSLMDFLAYLFPGTIMILVTVVLISISPLKYLLHQIPLNLVVGLILIATAYCMGVLLSSLMVSIEGLLLRYFRLSDPISTVPFEEFDSLVNNAFTKVFGDQGRWSANHFFLARTLVCEKLPRCAATIERQASLRQIRRNIVIPVLFLGIVGAIDGVKIFFTSPGHRCWGAIISTTSLIGSYVVARALVKNGMHSNRKRETRDVCSGLLVYVHSMTTSPLAKE